MQNNNRPFGRFFNLEAVIHRQIQYPGQILTDVELLTIQRHVMAGIAWLAQAVLGTNTVVTGLPCSPTSPASMAVQVGVGAIFSQQNFESTPYGSLAADTTAAHQIVKQGLNTSVQNLTCSAPTTTGQSVVYLIQAEYLDYDTNSAVLQYFNPANPSTAFTGPNGNGTSQFTTRQGLCSIALKAGTPASTGSQVAPTADSGWVPLYTVTVAYGATTITSANIAVAANAPFINYTLPQLKPGFSGSLQEFTSTGTWVCPANVTKVKARLWGAGGGGGGAYGVSGGNYSCAGAGGQSGGYCEGVFTVVPGTSYSITIGTGGAGLIGSTTNGTAATGGTTSFATFLSCTGGVGGQIGYSTAQATSLGGSGGAIATGGTLNTNGQSGMSSISGGNIAIVGGAGGCAPSGGPGGLTTYLAGQNGIYPGGGGGGSGNINSLTTGGTGANGLVILEW